MNIEHDTLSRTLWGEARGDGLDGMAAVASVILNRVHRPGWWGNDIVSVCQKPWQFSCWDKNDPNREKLLKVGLNDPQFQDAVMLARDAIAGELRDRTHGATGYYAPAVVSEPSWANGLTPTAKIGSQLFFKVQ